MSALGIRTIIAATDLTDELLPALQSAGRLAELTGAQLHIVHTTQTPVPESRLTEHLRLAGIPPTVRVEARILVGPPGALIVQDAFRLNADVIVFGSHRPGRTNLGSTTHRVLLQARTPCLMLPVRVRLPLQRVLAAVDATTPTRDLLGVALTVTSALRHREEHGKPTELLVLHAVADEGTADDALQRLSREVEDVQQPFGGAAGVNVNTRIAHGAPATAILDVADAEGVDLIVMGTHGRDPHRDPLGSVSHNVVTNARHPVLLVPPRAD